MKELGRPAEAEKIIAEALPNATEAEVNVYGYQLINEGKHDKAIEVLAMNTKKYPNSANAWDSLGEAYALKVIKPTPLKILRSH
jgi:predicted Zn-dependent protease